MRTGPLALIAETIKEIQHGPGPGGSLRQSEPALEYRFCIGSVGDGAASEVSDGTG
jgi:hypothetical protein